MPRFFSEAAHTGQKQIDITGPDVQHIGQVLRAKRGDKLTLCDREQRVYELEIQAMSKERIHCRVLSEAAESTEASFAITVFQALPRGDKMERLMRQAVELGAHRLVPVQMQRCQVQLSAQRAAKKQQRWQAVMRGAAEQSDRGRIPACAQLHSFTEALDALRGFAAAFVPYEGEKETTLLSYLERLEAPKELAFLIGPEGGFAAEELAAVKDAGLPTVSLGPRILRTETAAPAVLALTIPLLSHRKDSMS